MKRRKYSVMRAIQIIDTVLLFVLIYIMMFYVENIQGTARIVNYAGLVRGETQRMIKLEIAGQQQDNMITRLDTILDGVQNGSTSLDLVPIKTASYQEKVAQVRDYWLQLKAEVQVVRELGWQETEIVSMSEIYFTMCDEMVAQAEQYAQTCASNIHRTEMVIDVVAVILVALLLYRSIEAFRIMRTNSELDKKVYLDSQTGLPNKNKCKQLLDVPGAVHVPTSCFMFDLNNLKYTNDVMGHEVGDILICEFAQCLRDSAPKKYFVGRHGGDEFIAIFADTTNEDVQSFLAAVKDAVDSYNQKGKLSISYAVGYASSWEMDEPTMRDLLTQADENMYQHKKAIKNNSGSQP